MQHLFIMDLHQLLIVQSLLRELCQEPALRRLLRDNVHQDFTGCRHQEAKPVGAWLMQEHMLAQADTAAMLPIATLIILLRQPPEDIIVAVSLGILSGKGALMALALEASHGTDQNVYRSPLQAILGEVVTPATTIIILLPVHISPVVLQDTTGMAASV